ncbi:MAG: hypothetical protein GF344_07880 [Chitinivibrionales bacterium]|nr:hypothetical protein [Chitinivibrionales bacterium]MBD3356808.1 hypothetical protein [Chitinivibrionales bacterium]
MSRLPNCAKSNRNIDDRSPSYKLKFLFTALRRNNLTVLGVRPTSYETLYALGGIPALTCLVVLHFDQSGFTPLDRASSHFSNLAHSFESTGSVKLHIIERLQSRNGVYAIRTMDGITIKGLPNDIITGQVFPLDRANDESAYAQIIGHFTVSQLSSFDIDAHLEEWFRKYPYVFGEPRSHPLP